MGDWQPDKEFLEFLETIEIRSQTAKLIASRFMKEMRAGTPKGREIYERNWKDLEHRFRDYQSTRAKH